MERRRSYRSCVQADAIAGNEQLVVAHVGVVRREKNANVSGKTGQNEFLRLQMIEENF